MSAFQLVKIVRNLWSLLSIEVEREQEKMPRAMFANSEMEGHAFIFTRKKRSCSLVQFCSVAHEVSKGTRSGNPLGLSRREKGQKVQEKSDQGCCAQIVS